MSTQQPVLTPIQEEAVFQAAGLRVAAIVAKIRGPRVAELLPEIANLPVLGAFVSLKKVGSLRSCMGALSDAMPLAEAVESAATRSAKDDPRFPPITLSELPELDMEVWILWGMRMVEVRGRERAEVIEIGRHGIQIVQGGNRGLLLPGVAVEHQMDREEFLTAVCRKAGLPSSAWYDDRSMLYTFEGKAVEGPFTRVRIEDPALRKELEIAGRFQWHGSSAAGPSAEDVEELREICRHNLQAFFDGGRPDNFYPGLYNGNVSGLSVIVEIPDRPLMVCSKVGFRPEIPLQSSLFEMLRLMTDQIEHAGMTHMELADGRLDLAVFWDPRMHGTALSHDLSGVETSRRSLMVSALEGWITQYRPDMGAEKLLADCVRYLHIREPEAAEVMSMETICTAPRVLVTNISKRDDYPQRRSAAVAGAFYPAEPKRTDEELDRIFRVGAKKYPPAGPDRTPGEYSAVLVPHAGWIFSGELAAATFARVRLPERVIVFAPKHRPGGLDWAVAPYGTWEFPGASLAGDPDFCARMVSAVDLFQFDPIPHREEHAIEVQLPLLHRLRPDVRVVGMTLATASWSLIAEAAAELAAFLMHQETMPLLVISSDMNHYASEEMTRTVDQMALERMSALDPEGLLNCVRENRISMCGATGAALVLETLRLCDALNEAVLVGHTTSAARTGDTERVVGYAGMLFR